MKMSTHRIIVKREGRKYWAYSEDFPGVYGLGKSIEEAKVSVLESMRLYTEYRVKRPAPLPHAVGRFRCNS
jgi:predicted RNase H-like HicB family nuclease